MRMVFVPSLIPCCAADITARSVVFTVMERYLYAEMGGTACGGLCAVERGGKLVLHTYTVASIHSLMEDVGT